MQLPTQQQFVADCLTKYRWEPIPSDQKWEAAHFPLPKCSGEHETVQLWSADHTVQGLLQSVELDHQCFHYKANKKDLYNLETYYPEYLPLFKQLKSHFNSRQGKIGGRTSGRNAVMNKTGIHAPGMASIGGKKSSATNKANGTNAFFDPKIQSANGKKIAELKVGIHAPGMQSAGGKKGGKIGGKIGSKITNAQRYQCSVTHHVSTPAGLSNYQKARGIDTSLRVRRLDLEG